MDMRSFGYILMIKIMDMGPLETNRWLHQYIWGLWAQIDGQTDGYGIFGHNLMINSMEMGPLETI